MSPGKKTLTDKEKYLLFLRLCGEDPRICGIKDWLVSKCHLQSIFEALRRYVENPSDLNELTRAREKDFRLNYNQAMRGASSEGERDHLMHLHDNAKEAFSTKRKGVAHCTESLVWAEYYIEVKCSQRPTADQLALLIETTLEALGRRDSYIDAESLRSELSRFKKKNPRWMLLMQADIKRIITSQ